MFTYSINEYMNGWMNNRRGRRKQIPVWGRDSFSHRQSQKERHKFAERNWHTKAECKHYYFIVFFGTMVVYTGIKGLTCADSFPVSKSSLEIIFGLTPVN